MMKSKCIRCILPVVIFFSLNIAAISQEKAGNEMEISCSCFSQGKSIHRKYTCDGKNVSPPIEWRKVPRDTKSFALVCDDPDAPMGTWVHWLYYDIPGNMRGLPEDVHPVEKPAIGGFQGLNSFMRYGYGGPCPPHGTHRYFIKLYALDQKLGLTHGTTKSRLMRMIKNHVLGRAELMGRYSR